MSVVTLSFTSLKESKHYTKVIKESMFQLRLLLDKPREIFSCGSLREKNMIFFLLILEPNLTALRMDRLILKKLTNLMTDRLFILFSNFQLDQQIMVMPISNS